MSRAAVSSACFGGFLLFMGAGLVGAPGFLLELFRLQPATDPYIRLLGAVLVPFGVYYFHAARHELTEFFRITVLVRPFMLFVYAGFWLTGLTGPTLMLIGVVEMAGAVWTALALRADSRNASDIKPIQSNS